MPHTIEELTNLAFSIFPKGITDNSDSYQLTNEFQNLLRLTEKKEEYSQRLALLSSEVVSSFNEYSFENFSMLLKYDRCVKGRFMKTFESKSSIGLFISLIIPNYVILEIPHLINPKSIRDLNNSKTYYDLSISENQMINGAINLNVKKYYPDYSQFDIDLLDIEVPDIVFDGNGSLASFSNSLYSNNMTFFNIFFSSNYLIA
ncbi:MAG: hypothetical protein ACK5DG_14880 [Chitinophagaceae bacterium]|jgi:hypothetical protein